MRAGLSHVIWALLLTAQVLSEKPVLSANLTEWTERASDSRKRKVDEGQGVCMHWAV